MMVYDIETLRGPGEVDGGWDNPNGMGFGTAVAYDTDADHFQCFAYCDEMDAQALINHLTGHDVLTFNGIKFDNAVLLGNSYQIDRNPLWTDYDLLAEIIGAKFEIDVPPGDIIPQAVKEYGVKAVFDGSCNLDNLCWHTLGRRKTGHGAHAPQLIREGKWCDVWQYNLQDVRLTWALYQFWQQEGFVIDGNDRIIRRIPLEFIRA